MDSITLENFRCFREKQTVRLAPLTLLVGENSTGKTSFLALIRALWDMAYDSRIPDFREEPWDLGSYDEIVHHRGARGGKAVDGFEVGFGKKAKNVGAGAATSFAFRMVNDGSAPTQSVRRIARGQKWIDETLHPRSKYSMAMGVGRKRWEVNQEGVRGPLEHVGFVAPPAWPLVRIVRTHAYDELVSTNGSARIDPNEAETLMRMATRTHRRGGKRPFASAPVRSRPKRTYDPTRPDEDSEGDYVPMYLAELEASDPDAWQTLRLTMEKFGKSAGLFDEIRVKRFPGGGSPFQIQVRKADAGRKGPFRNIVDMGYGVSQALPIMAELFRLDAPDMLLLQQPEVHLHPSAQAALGTWFCKIAGSEKRPRQLIVETHSDYLIDRIRMDVRDGATELTPHDVVVLYFEREGLDVRIHAIDFDGFGILEGAPPSYGRFFMEEVDRSIWPEREPSLE